MWSGYLPSHQLLWFLANIYLDPGFEPLISKRWARGFYPFGHRVGGNLTTIGKRPTVSYQFIKSHNCKLSTLEEYTTASYEFKKNLTTTS